MKQLMTFFLMLAYSLLIQAEVPFYFLQSHPELAGDPISLSAWETQLIDHVKSSIDFAEQGISKITPEILAIDGMSSAKNRNLLNNLCTLQNTNYLEIGCWKGSTFVSALYQNQDYLTSATGIDNWSEFGGPINEFKSNCKKFISDTQYQFISADSFSVSPETMIPLPVNIYFYDGNHSQSAQEQAFTHYNSILDNDFIAIVDDWNWNQVREGTFSAFLSLNYEVLYEVSLPANYNCDLDNWWNGLYIAVIKKNTSF